MDEIIKRISERLSAYSSRRGFFSTMSKVVLGAAGVITGQGFLAQTAEARTLQCCTGTPCLSKGCPSGSSVTYIWSCGDHFYCNDCSYTDSSGSRHYVCTYFTA
jgi:hypothetical protein